MQFLKLTMKKTSVFMLALCLVFADCNKDPKPLTEIEKKEAATRGKWQLLRVTDSLHQTLHKC